MPTTAQREHSSTILVVDDHPELREMLKRLLEREGFQIAEASHGAEALTYLRSGAALRGMIVDLGMPVMNGWDLLAQWKADPTFRPVSTVILTGLINHPRLQELEGMVILTKPFQIDELLSAIRRMTS